MELKTLLYEKADGVATITLNRPKAFNALNDELMGELDRLMDEVAADDEVKAVIITGNAKAFAAGGDIAYMASADPLKAEAFIALCHRAIDKIENLDKPVIAAIAGMALGGGCELAMGCDIRIAAEGAIIGQPEINLGIMPGAGGTQRLARLVGMGWAKQLIFSGENIDAETALRIGLVNKVVPAESLLEEATKLAKKLAAKAPVAMRMAKKCINLGANVDLASGLVFEQKVWSFLFATADQKEGMAAFLEKRKPVFQGR
ncbi:MAG: enoyl-CoA hydratase-related protein [Syntrophomonadaceae bacterium]|nr:enoyl-CoA hydratase-related protein [Syntrophomonadaceae bacterium]